MFFAKKKEYKTYYDAYFMIIFKSAYKQINHLDDAKDLCHNVFTKFYQKYNEIEHKKAWLFGTLRMEIYDYLRLKKKKNKEIEIDDIHEIPLKSSHVINESDHDLRILLTEALQSENEISQSIFELRSVYQWTYTEIAEHYDLTPRQVKYSYEQVKKRLYDFFRKKGITSIGELL